MVSLPNLIVWCSHLQLMLYKNMSKFVIPVVLVDPRVFFKVIYSFIINHFLPTYFSIHLCVSGQLRSIWPTTSSPRHNTYVGIYVSILPSEEAFSTHILTNYSSQVPAWGDDIRSAGPQVPYPCLTPMFITAFTNTSQCTLILSQTHTVHTPAPYLSIPLWHITA